MRMLTRREFGKSVGTGALALGIGEVSMGLACPLAATVFTEIADYVPIGVNSFNEILTLIDPGEEAMLAPLTADIKAAFADLAADVASYQQAPAADKATWEGKIATVLNLLIGNLQSFWSTANLPDGTLAETIEGVLQIVLSTLAAFVPLLGGVVSMAFSAHALAPKKTIPILPRAGKQLKAKQVKSDINAVFATHGYKNKIN